MESEYLSKSGLDCWWSLLFACTVRKCGPFLLPQFTWIPNFHLFHQLWVFRILHWSILSISKYTIYSFLPFPIIPIFSSFISLSFSMSWLFIPLIRLSLNPIPTWLFPLRLKFLNDSSISEVIFFRLGRFLFQMIKDWLPCTIMIIKLALVTSLNSSAVLYI